MMKNFKVTKMSKDKDDLEAKANQSETQGNNKKDNIEVITEREFNFGMYSMLKEYSSKIKEYTDAYNELIGMLEDVKTYKFIGYDILFTYNKSDGHYYYTITDPREIGFKVRQNDETKQENQKKKDN